MFGLHGEIADNAVVMVGEQARRPIMQGWSDYSYVMIVRHHTCWRPCSACKSPAASS